MLCLNFNAALVQSQTSTSTGYSPRVDFSFEIYSSSWPCMVHVNKKGEFCEWASAQVSLVHDALFKMSTLCLLYCV